MHNRTAGIPGLQFILPIERLEEIICRVHRQLAGVGIVRLPYRAIGSGGDDVGIRVTIQHGEPVARALGRRCLQVVELSRLILVLLEAVPHKVHDAQRKIAGAFIRQIHTHKVQASLVHTIETDGVKVIGPILTKLPLDGV